MGFCDCESHPCWTGICRYLECTDICSTDAADTDSCAQPHLWIRILISGVTIIHGMAPDGSADPSVLCLTSVILSEISFQPYKLIALIS